MRADHRCRRHLGEPDGWKVGCVGQSDEAKSTDRVERGSQFFSEARAVACKHR